VCSCLEVDSVCVEVASVCVEVESVRGKYRVATISRLFKSYVSFAEYRLFYRALLQKRPIIVRSLRIVAIQDLADGCCLYMRHTDGCRKATLLHF